MARSSPTTSCGRTRRCRNRPAASRRSRSSCSLLSRLPGPALQRARSAGDGVNGDPVAWGLVDGGHDPRRRSTRPASPRRAARCGSRASTVDDARRAHRPLPRVLRHERPRSPARHRARAGQPGGARHGGAPAPAGPLHAPVSGPPATTTSSSSARSIGGCTAARLFAQRGARVALIETQPATRPPTRPSAPTTSSPARRRRSRSSASRRCSTTAARSTTASTSGRATAAGSAPRRRRPSATASPASARPVPARPRRRDPGRRAPLRLDGDRPAAVTDAPAA